MKKRQTHTQTYREKLRSGGLGSRMEKAQHPEAYPCLLYNLWKARQGYSPQLNTRQEGGLANLGMIHLQPLNILRKIKTMVDISTHSQPLHSTQRKAVSLLWASPWVGFAMPMELGHWGPDMAMLVATIHIHSGFHQLPHRLRICSQQ